MTKSTKVRDLMNLNKVKIDDPFWNQRIKLVREKIIPYQWDALNDNIPDASPSHAVENFKLAAGVASGEFHGMVFQDSDVAKWIEAASYSLIHYPDANLEQTIDELAELIGKAQQEDGYLNTYFTVAKPEKRWNDFSHGHELYCAGHMIEAAVAYFHATRKRNLLSIVCRYVDYIDQIMGPEEGKKKTYPGHPEIELALVKLYKVTGEKRYLKLSEYFIDERGKQPSFLKEEETLAFGQNDKWFDLDYHQAHQPVRLQEKAEGHSVRAMYLYAAMADIVKQTGSSSLRKSLKTLWDNVVNQRMYITGALGSQGHGERFTFDYDLPNDVAYAETCASIGLIFWAQRMLQIETNSSYADVMERALYNGVLSGMSLDGTKYFYVNPLEVYPKAANYRSDHIHIETERVSWFGCACCPPNIARLLTSLGEYIYTHDDNSIYTHLYIGNKTSLLINDTGLNLIQKTNYPWKGDVSITVNPEKTMEFALYFRIPGWCKNYIVQVNGKGLNCDVENGYLKIKRIWEKGDAIELVFDMPVEKMRAHPSIRENAGKLALQRGPIVFCFEEVDNGGELANLSISKDSSFKIEYKKDLLEGITVLTGKANRIVDNRMTNSLYSSAEHEEESVTVQAVPYSYWGNRKTGEMLVWIRE